ncbi:hypothetical protein [Chryseobacterium sp.]|uniref:hypothetical protein n=1 Tax=Chryseobacterium sp. TaxID=1871047 RepID=UPI0025C5724E|nr:hypothetical protein [Chryseobacterium sp.]MBV8326194.1 hypothetical protein [Chryseobacterium sp.]
MKKLIAGAFALSLLATAVSCKKEAKTEIPSTGTDSLAATVPVDSVAGPKKDSVSAAASTTSAGIDLITKSTGKYPHDIKLFEDKNLTDRLKKLTGTQYDEMIKSFNVESPIVSENGIYKLNGCKQHDCPGYSTTMYYDAKNDNLNVAIDKNGKVADFAEKGKITVPDHLKSK